MQTNITIPGIGYESREELERDVASVDKWWHRIELGHGVVSPGRKASDKGLDWLHLPEDLSGKTVLDIGAWDGHFSFEAERRGAKRVLAIDIHAKRGFFVAHRALRSRVEFRQMSVFDLDPAETGRFDVVIYSGVVYHLPNPMESLVRVRSVATDLVIVETDSALNHLRVPAAEFRGEPQGLISDSPNWWIPNESCLHEMLRAAGFRQMETRFHQHWSDQAAYRAALKKAAIRSLPRWVPGPAHSRLIVHAWT